MGIGAIVFLPNAQAAGDDADRLRAQLVRERRADAREDARFRRVIRAHRRLTTLVRNPSPTNNRALARLLLSPSQFSAMDVIATGESSWHHTVWNGGHLGAWPDRSDHDGACDVGEAYGIGQACERTKMQAWAGTPGVYELPSLQTWWAKAYADGRYGSLEAAGAFWRANRHW